jgi:hypothetical protein
MQAKLADRNEGLIPAGIGTADASLRQQSWTAASNLQRTPPTWPAAIRAKLA